MFRLRPGEARDLHRTRGGQLGCATSCERAHMEFIDFQERIFDVLKHIQDALRDTLDGADLRPLAGIEGLRTIVRNATLDLMLATDVEAEMKRLSQEPRTLLCIYLMYEKMDIMAMATMVKTAQLAAPPNCDALPFYPFCAFMLEACDRLTLNPKLPKKPLAKAKKTRPRKAKES